MSRWRGLGGGRAVGGEGEMEDVQMADAEGVDGPVGVRLGAWT